MGGNVQPKDVPITFIDRNPKIGTKFKNLILSVLGYGGKLSRTAQVGREALPAHPIRAPHFEIVESEEVSTYEANKIANANDPKAIDARRTRKLPQIEKKEE